MITSSSNNIVVLTSSLNNEFQWKNLYTKQYGPCTYAPPPPSNPTTTTSSFPKRRDLNDELRFEDDYYGVKSRATEAKHNYDSSEEDEPAQVNAESGMDDDLFDLFGDDMFGANFFDFLKEKKGKKSESPEALTGPTGEVQQHYATSNGPNTKLNPRHVSREMFNLHRNAWTLLMDDRPMAWLEREATERGSRAADVKQRLLDVVMGLGFQAQNGAAGGGSGPSMEKKKMEAAAALSSLAGSISGATSGAGASDAAQDPEGHRMSYFQKSRGLAISQEEAQQRINDTFNPYFAVISPPNTIRRYREHFFASKRAQLNGLSGLSADIVGLPLFSQFATWKETYNHRTSWEHTPFSFFLMHDACFNYAHISAMYMLLNVIGSHCHVHSYHCLDSKRPTVALKEARFLMAQARSLRRDAERQYRLCPLFAIQELTENLLIAFEQGTSRNTLLMIMHVVAFVTDCVIDAETANHFFSPKELLRQSQFDIPGMNTTARKDTDGGRDLSGRKGTTVGGTSIGAADEFEESQSGVGVDGNGNAAEDRANLVDVFARQIFSTDEFESLFDLCTWFTDNAVSNSRVPIDGNLLPPTKYVRVEEINEMSVTLPSAAASKSFQSTSQGNISPMRSPRAQKLDPNESSFSKSRSHRPRFVSTVPLKSPDSEDADKRPKVHSYIPGREQLYRGPDSLVDVIARYCARREELLHNKRNGTVFEEAPLPEAKEGKRKGKDAGRSTAVPPLASAPTPPIEEHMSLSTTRLATPLIIITSYIQLHGAPWLKHLLDRVFNVLRKESVLLYVNRLDLEHPMLSKGGFLESTPDTSYTSPSIGTGTVEGSGVTGLRTRMEYLEDLICQDILYVMSELFNALYGERSTTRMPQGITTLLTQFCATMHLHLLGNTVLTSNKAAAKPGSATKQVMDSVNVLKQKRLAARGIRPDYVTDSSMVRLISSVERFRLAKFILFDSWIIPALTSAVDAGYLSESSSLHLRWNVDAFARYLKILINAPFTKQNQLVTVQPPPPPLPPAPPVGRSKKSNSRVGASTLLTSPPAASAKKKKPQATVDTTPPNTFPLPPYITGIYDVSSGTLVRLYSPDDIDGAVAASLAETPAPDYTMSLYGVSKTLTMLPGVLHRKSLGEESQSLSMQEVSTRRHPHQQEPQLASALAMKYALYKSMDTASLEDVSSKLHSLNESLGILNYDPDEQDVESANSSVGTGAPAFHNAGCAMRVLDLFCRTVACETSDNIVVSEYEVLPSMAAGCVDSIYQFVTGAHPIVAAAMDTDRIPSTMPFSPYLSCLSAVLLHPSTASHVLDNIYKNSKRFYNTLMSPLRDQSMLQLISALIEERDDLPLVDANALTPLLQSYRPVVGVATKGGAGAGGREGSQDTAVARYEEEARRLRRHQHLLGSGAPPIASGAEEILRNVGPQDPMQVLKAGRDRIINECGVVPLCFDPWWRAMALALCVRAMNVMSECNDNRSKDFLLRCQTEVQEAKAEYKALISEFVETKGTQTVEGGINAPKKVATPTKNTVKRKSEAPKKKIKKRT